ncbi:MAG: YbjN domain-containing protein [Magnetococcales bacterium]|nr:YbjN domain-containing protein [Magnetococcales bacterium]
MNESDYSTVDDLPEYPTNNPVSMVEEFVINQDWNSERSNEYELWAEVPSQWGNQRLWVVYHEETGYLQFNCYLNLKIPARQFLSAVHTMTLMNERVWLGHFEIWSEEQVPVFRVVLPLRKTELQEPQLEDVMTAMQDETDRFFPAIQWVVWGGKTPEEAIAAAIVETEGEA